MKNLSLLLLILFSVTAGYSQVKADPALDSLNFSDLPKNDTIDATKLAFDNIVNLKVPILNQDKLSSLPPGTCKIKIGLGSKLVLDPSFDLNSTNTSSYFDWTVVNSGGQVQLTGDLKSQLPADFNTLGEFRVKGSLLGNSTITINFLVTNHNSTVVLSDEDPTNNSEFIAYTVVERSGGPLPVTFTRLALKNEDCGIKVDFSTEHEVNVKQFEIEVSNNGRNFTNVAQIAANHLLNYKSRFQLTDNLKAPLLYIRIKSVDIDGKFQYSTTSTVAGTCNGKLGIRLYPNPVSINNSELTLKAQEVLFNGKLSIALLDITGKTILQKEMSLLNADQVKLKTGLLASGQYLLKITGNQISSPLILRFQQL